MKKIGLDGRSEEEKMLEELKLGNEERKDIVLNIQNDC